VDLVAAGLAGHDPADQLALDEALLRAGQVRPLARLWRAARCVVVGRGQQLEREVNLAASVRDGIPVLRRSSGGGTVYLDPGCLNVTLVAPGRRPDLIEALAELIAGSLGRLGLAPTAGRRGVFLGPAKVSGLSAQVTSGGSLAHGTLLITTPPAAVVAYLAPAPPDPRPLDSHRSPVAALSGLDPAITIRAGRQAVLAEAATRFGDLRPRRLTAAERDWWARLAASRYDNPDWHQTGRDAPARLRGDSPRHLPTG
jgi:lipoate-protein ligase A